MSTLDKTVQEFLQIFEEAGRKGTSPYDTQAEVKRVEDGIAWVHIAGGVDETPVKLTVNAKVGDVVQVRVSGGQAFLIGNVTAPPTDDSTALQAIEASRAAKRAAIQAEKDAETAANAATQAQSDAQAAHSAATEAIETAESVHDIAVQAQEDAEAATTAAGQATQAANNASNLATQAQSAAQAANTAAGQAQSEAQAASAAAGQAQTAATQVQNNLKSVVQGASTVEKAVSVMQTALEAVVGYDPTNDTVQEYFWHDANGAHVLGDTSGYRNDIDSTGMRIIDVNTEDSVAQFGADGIQLGDRTVFISGNAVDVQIWTEALSETTTLPAQINLSSHETFDEIYLGIKRSGETSGVAHYFSYGHAQTTLDGQLSIYYDGANALTISPRSSSFSVDIVVNLHTQKAGGVFSFGQRLGDEGAFSSIFGESLIASGDNQFVIGKYNEEDSQKAFIIGNGSVNSSQTEVVIERVNVLTVDWAGNVNIANGAKYKIGGNDLSASDVGAVPITRKVNNKALSADVTLSASDVGAIPSASVSDYVTTQGVASGWYWRKWNSGKIEAWGITSFTARTGSAWGSFYYSDIDVSIPTNVFASALPIRAYATGTNFQWMALGVSIDSGATVRVRMVKPVSSSQAGGIYLYLFSA